LEEAGGIGSERAVAGWASSRRVADDEVAADDWSEEVGNSWSEIREREERGSTGTVESNGTEVLLCGGEKEAGEWEAIAAEGQGVGVAAGGGGEFE
jgi:hypothetical protein